MSAAPTRPGARPTALWVRTFGGLASTAEGLRVAPTATGGAVLLAKFKGVLEAEPLPFIHAGSTAGWVAAFDGHGHALWARALGRVRSHGTDAEEIQPVALRLDAAGDIHAAFNTRAGVSVQAGMGAAGSGLSLAASDHLRPIVATFSPTGDPRTLTETPQPATAEAIGFTPGGGLATRLTEGTRQRVAGAGGNERQDPRTTITTPLWLTSLGVTPGPRSVVFGGLDGALATPPLQSTGYFDAFAVDLASGQGFVTAGPREGDAAFTAAAPLPNGGFLFIGTFAARELALPAPLAPLTSPGEKSLVTIGTDASLTPIFARAIGFEGSWTEARCAAALPDGRVLIGGRFEGSFEFGGEWHHAHSGTDGFLLRVQPDGTPDGFWRLGGIGSETVNDIAVGPRGEVFVTGQFGGQIDLGTGVLNATGYGDLFIASLVL
jgi:hypothetical protein